MRDQFSRWLYLGLGKEIYMRNRSPLDLANLRVLQQICIALGGCAVLIAGFSLVFLHDGVRLLFSAIAFLFELGVYFASARLLKRTDGPSHASVISLIHLSSVVMYVSFILMGTAYSDGDLAVLAVWVFLFVPMALDLLPLETISVELPCYVLFLVLSRRYKSDLIFCYDLLNSLISISVGLFMSRRKCALMITKLEAERRLRRANYDLYYSSTTDALTGLPNRRLVFERYDALAKSCLAANQCLCIAIMDLDEFKAYNDCYGHPAGDVLLKKVGAAFLQVAAQNGFMVGRIGGEEFMALWAGDGVHTPEAMAEALRESVEALGLPHEDSSTAPVMTLSAGCCLAEGESIPRAYSCADRALYAAKGAGRNRVYQYCSDGECRPVAA